MFGELNIDYCQIIQRFYDLGVHGRKKLVIWLEATPFMRVTIQLDGAPLDLGFVSSREIFKKMYIYFVIMKFCYVSLKGGSFRKVNKNF